MIPENFDFTHQGRRPSAQQIVSRWKQAGRPTHFTVTYGETEAEFQYFSPTTRVGYGCWIDSGNGCRGVNREQVVSLLKQEGEPQ